MGCGTGTEHCKKSPPPLLVSFKSETKRPKRPSSLSRTMSLVTSKPGPSSISTSPRGPHVPTTKLWEDEGGRAKDFPIYAREARLA